MDNFMLMPSGKNVNSLRSLRENNNAKRSTVLKPRKLARNFLRESFSNRLCGKESKSGNIVRISARKCLEKKYDVKRLFFDKQQENVVGYDENGKKERKVNIGRTQNVNRVKEGRVSRRSTPLGRSKRVRTSIFSSNKSLMIRNTFHLREALWEEILEIRKKQESSNRRYPLRVRKLNVRYGYT
uniref:Uncharacterized protein n=1 Tax=Strongyloides venezuelensis TaxID=75913 RepID=A0A0K0FVJ9_STRVS